MRRSRLWLARLVSAGALLAATLAPAVPPASAAPAAPPAGAAPAPPAVSATFSSSPDTGATAQATWTATLTLPAPLARRSIALVLPTLESGSPAFVVSPSIAAADVEIDGQTPARVQVLPVTTTRGPAGQPPRPIPPGNGAAASSLYLPGLDLGSGAGAPVAVVVTPPPPQGPPPHTVTVTVRGPAGTYNPPAGTYPVAVALVGPGPGQVRLAPTTATFVLGRGPNVIICCGGGGGGVGGGIGGGGGGPQNVSFSAALGAPQGGAYSNTSLYTASDTPCTSILGYQVCSGVNGAVSDQDTADGMVSVGAYAIGIATQQTQNALTGYIPMPNSTGATHANDSFSATINVYSVLASTNVGFLSNVSISVFQIQETSACETQTQSPSVSTGVVIGLPDNPSSVQDYLEQAEGPLQSAVEGLGSGDSLQNRLTSLVGDQLLTTTFQLSCSLPAGDNAPFTITPELTIGNAGLGGTGAYAISYVQVLVNGEEVPSVQPTTVTLTPASGSINFNQPTSLTATVSPDPGNGTTVYMEYPSTLGGPLDTSCVLSGGSCGFNITDDILPVGSDGMSAWWYGDGSYQGGAGQTTVNVSQGASGTTLSTSGNPAVGQPVTLTAQVSGLTNIVGASNLGVVSFFDAANSVVGTCSPSYSVGACSVTWTPGATGAYHLEAVWSGDQDEAGSASTPQWITIYPAGYSLSAVASPSFVGFTYRCVYDRLLRRTICNWYPTGSSSTVTATLRDNGVPDGGQSVDFGSSPGGQTFSPASCDTGGNGACSVTFTVSSPPSTRTTYSITASGDGASTSTNVTYTPSGG